MTPCRWCGDMYTHVGMCPRVKVIEFYELGGVKRVEFHERVEFYTPPPTGGADSQSAGDCGSRSLPSAAV